MCQVPRCAKCLPDEIRHARLVTRGAGTCSLRNVRLRLRDSAPSHEGALHEVHHLPSSECRVPSSSGLGKRAPEPASNPSTGSEMTKKFLKSSETRRRLTKQTSPHLQTVYDPRDVGMLELTDAVQACRPLLLPVTAPALGAALVRM